MLIASGVQFGAHGIVNKIHRLLNILVMSKFKVYDSQSNRFQFVLLSYHLPGSKLTKSEQNMKKRNKYDAVSDYD